MPCSRNVPCSTQERNLDNRQPTRFPTEDNGVRPGAILNNMIAFVQDSLCLSGELQAAYVDTLQEPSVRSSITSTAEHATTRASPVIALFAVNSGLLSALAQPAAGTLTRR